MAAVLNALPPFVIKMIKDMSEEELTMLLGVSVEIKKLGGKVESLEAYLADAERRRINEARVQRWVSKLKGPSVPLGAEERRNSKGGRCWESTVMEKAPGCLRPLLFLLRS
nr:unnamed protein product [Digitaria exilis]